MRNAILIGALLLASCMDPAQEAHDQYNMIERAGGTPSELCEAGKKIVSAYLEKGEEHEYQLYKASNDAKCLLVKLRGDNM